MPKEEIMHQRGNTFNDIFTVYTYTKFQTPLHFHKNLEFIYAIEGSVTVSVANSEYCLNAGECLLVFPYRVHSFISDESSKIWVATFPQEFIKAFYNPLVGKKAVNPVFKLSDATKDFLYSKLIEPFQPCAFFSAISKKLELTVKSCLYAVCSEYMEKVELVSENREAEAISIHVLQYISENFKDNISLRSAAEDLGYNYQYISRIFNQNIRFNFKTILNQYRFEHALTLLQETDKPITDVAFESGFQSLRTFNRVSYEMFHTSPKQCRKRISYAEKISPNKKSDHRSRQKAKSAESGEGKRAQKANKEK